MEAPATHIDQWSSLRRSKRGAPHAQWYAKAAVPMASMLGPSWLTAAPWQGLNGEKPVRTNGLGPDMGSCLAG